MYNNLFASCDNYWSNGFLIVTYNKIYEMNFIQDKGPKMSPKKGSIQNTFLYLGILCLISNILRGEYITHINYSTKWEFFGKKNFPF